MNLVTRQQESAWIDLMRLFEKLWERGLRGQAIVGPVQEFTGKPYQRQITSTYDKWEIRGSDAALTTLLNTAGDLLKRLPQAATDGLDIKAKSGPFKDRWLWFIATATNTVPDQTTTWSSNGSGYAVLSEPSLIRDVCHTSILGCETALVLISKNPYSLTERLTVPALLWIDRVFHVPIVRT